MLPKLKIDELEFFEPVKIKTVNDVIFECEEKEEKEDIKHVKPSLLSLRKKRRKIDFVMKQLRNSDQIKSKNLEHLFSLKTYNINRIKKQRNIIFENKDEYYSDN